MERRMANINEFERALGRLEGKMDSMVQKMGEMSASFESLEKGRLSRLEIEFAKFTTTIVDRASDAAKEATKKGQLNMLIFAGVISILVSIIGAVILKRLGL